MTSGTDNSNAIAGVVYFGVINLNEGRKNIGSVDIWRSVMNKELFCEEKRIGVLDISDKIGLHRIDGSKKWGVAVNRKRRGTNRWKLLDLVEKGIQRFLDPDDESIVEVTIDSFRIVDVDWWSFLVERNINRTVDIAEDPSGNVAK